MYALNCLLPVLLARYVSSGLATDDRRPTSHLGNFKYPYLREGSSDPLHVWFYSGVFGVGGSNGAVSNWTKFNRYLGENNARGVITLVTVKSISCC